MSICSVNLIQFSKSFQLIAVEAGASPVFDSSSADGFLLSSGYAGVAAT